MRIAILLLSQHLDVLVVEERHRREAARLQRSQLLAQLLLLGQHGHGVFTAKARGLLEHLGEVGVVAVEERQPFGRGSPVVLLREDGADALNEAKDWVTGLFG